MIDPVRAFANAVRLSIESQAKETRTPLPEDTAYAGWKTLAEAALIDARAAFKAGLRGADIDAFVAQQLAESWRREFDPNCSQSHFDAVRDNHWLPGASALIAAQTANLKMAGANA